MSSHHLFAQCDGIYYPPKEKVDINLYLYNFSDIPIIFSNIQIVFDFHIYFLNNEEIYVSPKSQLSKDYCFFLPDLGEERKDFSIKYDLQYFNNNSWKKYRSFISNDKNNYFIEIRSLREINTTRYIVFLSREKFFNIKFVVCVSETFMRKYLILL